MNDELYAIKAEMERRFVESPEAWKTIIQGLNNSILTWLDRYDQPTDSVMLFTYDDFCSTYLEYVLQFSALNHNQFSSNFTNSILHSMVVNRIPDELADNIERRRQAEMEEVAGAFADEPIEEEEVEEVAPRCTIDEVMRRVDSHVPKIWRVELSVIKEQRLEPADDDGWVD